MLTHVDRIYPILGAAVRWTAFTLGLIAMGTVGVVCFFQYKNRDSTWRRRMTLMPLGLKKNGKPKPHCVLDLDQFETLEAYLQSLERNARRSLSVQLVKSFKEHEIRVFSIKPDQVRFYKHWPVIFSHQRRCNNWLPVALFLSIMRYQIFYCMVGDIEEYYIGSQLVALNQSVIKGPTIRAMWFYQLPCKAGIWMFCLRLSVLRGFALRNDGIRFIDVGPSLQASLEKGKARYGCIPTKDWKEHYGASDDSDLRTFPAQLLSSALQDPFLVARQ